MTDFTSGEIRVASAALEAKIGDAVTALSFAGDTNQVSELTITIVDNGLPLRRGGLLVRGVTVEWGGLTLVVGDVSIESGPAGQNAAVTIKARPAVVRALKLRTGAQTWAGISPTDWLTAEVADVGGTLLAEPTPGGGSITRAAEPGQTPESSWDVAASKATELGFWLFHGAGDRIVFARPGWLKDQAEAAGALPELSLATVISWTTDETDDETLAASVVVTLERARAAGYRAGDVLSLTNTMGLDGTYVVTKLDLDAAQPDASITFTAPVDPAPRPLSAGGGGGRSGGGGITVPLPAITLPSMTIAPPPADAVGPYVPRTPGDDVTGGKTGRVFAQIAQGRTASSGAARAQAAMAAMGVTFPADPPSQYSACATLNPSEAVRLAGALLFALGGPNGVTDVGISTGTGHVLTGTGQTLYSPAQWQRGGTIRALRYP